MTSSPLRRRAFTLIELLIVITIIGILAVALIPRLTGGPARARDAQRQADLQQIATALEFLNSDKGGYPTYNGCISTSTVFVTALGSYLTTIPSDPNVTATAGLSTGEIATPACSTGYYYTGLGATQGTTLSEYTSTGYLLAADLETETSRNANVFNVATAFAVDTTETAAKNIETATVCDTATCGATSVIYVLGR